MCSEPLTLPSVHVLHNSTTNCKCQYTLYASMGMCYSGPVHVYGYTKVFVRHLIILFNTGESAWLRLIQKRRKYALCIIEMKGGICYKIFF